MSQRAFKKLYCDWRKRLFVELKGARLAVWLYHYLRSNKEDQAWPSIAGVARETGLHRDTIIQARKYLYSNGWLVKVEDTRFRTRRVAATFPNEQSSQSEIPTSNDEPPVGNSYHCQSEIPDTGKFRHEVDSSSEVDTKEAERESIASLPRSRADSLQAKPERLDVEADAVRVEATVRTWGVPLTAKVQKIIRRRLREGTGRGILECVVNSTMKAMPQDECKPQFYLGQNLDAEVERLLQHGEAAWQATVEEEAQIAAMAASHGGERL